ncbi:hypothetical protein AMATHDRAFT_7808 [Amanita thiersii Skay4041]|uniref:Uncharacterized protein n=1 Tax=Amanita thiersii Skay4041 TaxID=703135 RepID=A0A2A9NFA6_9AGAR|nr:hypothetical protein AMATHDRAFT_7808 [Amanita thiersii Skay4041]
MPSFEINSYHNFQIPILESTTNGLVESITARPLLQNLLQDVSALSAHVNNVRMVQLACLPIVPAGEEYVYLAECSKHVALESQILDYLIDQLSLVKHQNDKFALAYMNLHGWGHQGGVGFPPVDKTRISRPQPLRRYREDPIILHYDNHIWLYCKHLNSLQQDNHVHLYRQHQIKIKKREEKRQATELAQWRYQQRISQQEQDEAWDILQRLKCKQHFEDLRAQRRQDELWTTVQCLKHKDRYEDLRTKRHQDYARSHAYQMETLDHNLEYHPDLRRILLKDPKNRFLTWL